MRNKDTIIAQLQTLQLSADEALLYVELLRAPATHLGLSHTTGINRSKVYRLIETLEKRSLVTRRSDDRGMFLVATNPANLEIGIVTAEEALQRQRAAFHAILPDLSDLQTHDSSIFVTHTYEGEDGFKQMLWHELKAKDEVLVFGVGTYEELVNNHRWVEKYRAAIVEAGYINKQLRNGAAEQFTNNTTYTDHHLVSRRLSPAIAHIDDSMIAIYNDTVAFYHWQQSQKAGTEIVNRSYATMMRQLFYYFWDSKTPGTS
jgi:sugar-specific transcriptional regulator TrmB